MTSPNTTIADLQHNLSVMMDGYKAFKRLAAERLQEIERLKKLAKFDQELCSDHCAGLEEVICRQANEIESLRQDAERYRTIRQIMQSAKGGAFLECNRELGYYEKPEEGKEVRLQWYPDTPVGFYLVEASTIDAVVDKVKDQNEQYS